jgi:circadian clock protein KaiC
LCKSWRRQDLACRRRVKSDRLLEALFIRLDHAIRSIGAKRVVLDTIECLFGDLPDASTLRAELQRLFRWLKERGVTTVVTGERGNGSLTRHGLEEYVSDCVLLLDHRVNDQTSTRRLRIVKYRGSRHSSNEYPFVVDDDGLSILPITTLKLEHPASEQRISMGVAPLDDMLGGAGPYRGSCVLVSGTAGTGKSTLAAHFADAACARGERTLYFSFEESPSQIKRNLKMVGLDLAHWEQQGLLRFESSRPQMYGLEMHLLAIHKLLARFKPEVVILDPINSFIAGANKLDVKAMLVRLIDFLKQQQISHLLTSLTSADTALEKTDTDISSLIDTWLILRDVESNGERHRSLTVLKSRGMAHSSQVRKFHITSRGITLQAPASGHPEPAR